MDMSLSKLREIMKDREAWYDAVHGVSKRRTWLSEWTTTRHERTWCQEDLISIFCFLAIYFYYPQWSSERWFFQPSVSHTGGILVLAVLTINYGTLGIWPCEWQTSLKKLNNKLLLWKNWIIIRGINNWRNKMGGCSVQSLSHVRLFPPHEPQHARPPCPPPTPKFGVFPNPCSSSQWCHPTILSSVVLFSSCPQSFPASGSFQMSQLFA